MTRWVGRAIALLLLAGLVLFPAITWPSLSGDRARHGDDQQTTTPTSPSTRTAQLKVTETLAVNFPDYKHGIFRFFDVEDPGDARVRLIPRDISVTRDGQPEPFEMLREGHGRYRNVKIGSANTTMTGEHVYVIRYRIDDASLRPMTAAQFYWNLIPSGWQMPIAGSRLAVHLPANGDVECAVGQGTTGGCTATAPARGTLITHRRPRRRTPRSRCGPTLDLPAPERDALPWPVRFDAVLRPRAWSG